MESKGGKKKSSSSNSLDYEAPLGYSIEDIRPHGGIKKFQSAAYSNVRITMRRNKKEIQFICYNRSLNPNLLFRFHCLQCAKEPS
ncbi:hypothetical protein BHE74_00059239 [Ensete ventricosum]|nr:hypothetical protein BHE74_00059239 [Ensete ventricosum]